LHHAVNQRERYDIGQLIYQRPLYLNPRRVQQYHTQFCIEAIISLLFHDQTYLPREKTHIRSILMTFR
jgi:hypothetical protein